jgi:hypothetical protein
MKSPLVDVFVFLFTIFFIIFTMVFVKWIFSGKIKKNIKIVTYNVLSTQMEHLMKDTQFLPGKIRLPKIKKEIEEYVQNCYVINLQEMNQHIYDFLAPMFAKYNYFCDMAQSDDPRMTVATAYPASMRHSKLQNLVIRVGDKIIVPENVENLTVSRPPPDSAPAKAGNTMWQELKSRDRKMLVVPLDIDGVTIYDINYHFYPYHYWDAAMLVQIDTVKTEIQRICGKTTLFVVATDTNVNAIPGVNDPIFAFLKNGTIDNDRIRPYISWVPRAPFKFESARDYTDGSISQYYTTQCRNTKGDEFIGILDHILYGNFPDGTKVVSKSKPVTPDMPNEDNGSDHVPVEAVFFF